MSDNSPDPPEEIPSDIVDRLAGCSSDQLQAIATYAEQLATADTGPTPEDSEQSEPPEGVPAKATVTTKEINDNRYHYWQWREGDTIKSQYKGPAADAE